MVKASDCKFHEAHELRIKNNEKKHDTAVSQRLALHAKDEELEQMFNKYKWIGIGFATCFTAVTTMTSAALAAGWWLLGNPSVVKAALQMRGE